MKKQNSSTPEKSILRQRAIELLKKKQSRPIAQRSQAETLKLIHELQVYQVDSRYRTKNPHRQQPAANVAAKKQMENGCARLLNIINDIVDISK